MEQFSVNCAVGCGFVGLFRWMNLWVGDVAKPNNPGDGIKPNNQGDVRLKRINLLVKALLCAC